MIGNLMTVSAVTPMAPAWLPCALTFLLPQQPNASPYVALHNNHGGWGQRSSKGAKRRPLSERNGTMLNTISSSPSLIIPVKALWRRLIDSLANRLEERRAQAELALMTLRDRFDLDVACGNLAWSTLAHTAQRGDTNLAGNKAGL